jgi:hypothetical protein
VQGESSTGGGVGRVEKGRGSASELMIKDSKHIVKLGARRHLYT